ncbi:hypothetical protein C0993_003176 [Termitomyces sp. T159_Od127]|nr:hypothetical protein C0993_003176 [Termitomyces sp. T159_Od127]
MIYAQPSPPAQEANDHSLSIASNPYLPAIITASMIFFVVDATISLLRRPALKPETIVISESSGSEPRRPLARFVDKSRSVLEDFQVLEKQLAFSRSRCFRYSMLKQRRRDRRLAVLDPKPLKSNRRPSCEFTAFCERLLLTNKIWKQERELETLRAASDAKSRASRSTAFTTFCEQLLLWNRIWKLEQETAELVLEKERIQRERMAVVTRAAKRMVQDVQKERMVEEFVKDLVDEVGTAKAEIWIMKEKHEREVEEIQGEWVKDYRRVKEELDRLKLAQSARLAEQELSNSTEESLFERIKEGKRRVEELEESLKGVGYASSDKATEDEASDVDSELVSDLSSSTCVSSRASSVRRSSATALNRIPERKRCVNQGTSPAPRKSQHSRTSGAPHTRNPVVSQRKYASIMSRNRIHSARPLAVWRRTTTAAFRAPPATPTSGSTSKSTSLDNRAPWRV